MAIERLLVVGAGQMGSGIAQVAAQAGIHVQLVDSTASALEAGFARIRDLLERAVTKGKLAPDAREKALSLIHPTPSVEKAEASDFAIEAATENADLKRQIFMALDRVLPPTAILATNTSSIPITRLAAATKRPEQVIGMHFMNPVPVMTLVEVIRAVQTSEPTYQATLAFAERLGKKTVTSKDHPGFIVNRVLIPLINEACFALSEGLASAEDIDQAVRLGLNHPMGPLQLADFIGLDTCLYIAEVLHDGIGEDKYRPAPILRQYVDAGWLGKKSGRGFYKY